MSLLKLTDIGVQYDPGSTVWAVRNAGLDVTEGEVVSVIGESGSGKTSLGRVAAGLLRPSEGEAHFAGHNLFAINRESWRDLRREISVVFQEPVESLDPRMRILAAVAEPLRSGHSPLAKREAYQRAAAALSTVGLDEAFFLRYPRQLSGGQCQRVGIARAVVTSPRLLILDEPTSALDVSIRRDIIDLLLELKARLNLTLLLISHDIDTVGLISDRVAVMCEGRVVEVDAAPTVLTAPRHAYTRQLLAARLSIPTSMHAHANLLGGGADRRQSRGSSCP